MATSMLHVANKTWLWCRSMGMITVPFLVCLILGGSQVQAQEQASTRASFTLRIQPLSLLLPGRDITTLPNYDHIGSPSCTKDGEWIAFDSYKSVTATSVSPPECWIVRQDGTGLKKLADGSAPRWSPDGKRLLFMREGQGAAPGQVLGIFVIDRDGKGERRIGPGRWPEWSPDGERIAFSLGEGLGGGVRRMARIYTARIDGTDQRLICNGDCPSWSYDGKKIACSDPDPARPAPEIRVVDLETRQEVIVGYGWYRPNWSPDGKTLVCNGYAGPDQVMVRISSSIPNQEPESLQSGRELGTSPCFGTKGSSIIFILIRPRNAR